MQFSSLDKQHKHDVFSREHTKNESESIFKYLSYLLKYFFVNKTEVHKEV